MVGDTVGEGVFNRDHTSVVCSCALVWAYFLRSELTVANCSIVSHSLWVITPSNTTRLVPFKASSSMVMVTPTCGMGPPGEWTRKKRWGREIAGLNTVMDTHWKLKQESGPAVSYLHKTHCHPSAPPSPPASFSHSVSLFQPWRWYLK